MGQSSPIQQTQSEIEPIERLGIVEIILPGPELHGTVDVDGKTVEVTFYAERDDNGEYRATGFVSRMIGGPTDS